MYYIPNSIDAFQTLEGLKLHSNYIFNRLRDCSLANDKLYEENVSLKKEIDDLKRINRIDSSSRYNKVLTQNKKLKDSLQKLFVKYVQPTLIDPSI